jgi:hypothetical protein
MRGSCLSPAGVWLERVTNKNENQKTNSQDSVGGVSGDKQAPEQFS